MKAEKVVLSFIAVAIGLAVAGIAFYLYQSSKVLPESETKTVSAKPSPSPTESGFFLSVSEPADEAVYNKKVVKISGKTTSDATVIIITETDQEIIHPNRSGDFSTTVNISDGQNLIRISALSKQGEEKSVDKIVTFSTEEF